MLSISLAILGAVHYRSRRRAGQALADCRRALAATQAEAEQYARQAQDQAREIASLSDLLKLKEAATAEAQSQADQVLLNILPYPIAQRLKAGEQVIVDSFTNVTVLFADIVGFTHFAATTPPHQVVELLNRVFSLFDIFSEQYAVEKIKTIGDAYMIVSGVPEPREEHTEAIADMALEIQTTIELLAHSLDLPVQVRIGIHTGPAVAGVIGKKKFSYDLWGDTVNIASRLESHGEPSRIHVSEAVYEKLKHAYVFEERGTIELKGKGAMRTFFLLDKQD
ncbi:adenylate/guanylate cyclase domain-containing protein [Methylomagnum sp.]